MANKKLGKGLGTIFGNDVDSILADINNGEKEVKGDKVNLKISEIRPNPYQPRKNFDEEKLKELAESIKERGIFQPVLVRKSALKGYELIAGERRMKASKMAGLKEIPAFVLDFDDADMMEVSLLENIQRDDLNPIEEAEAYNQIIEKLGYTQEELAKKISKSRAYVTNTLRLNKLPKKVKELVIKGSLTYGHARTLLGLDDEERMSEIANRIIKENLTVREVEKLVNKKPKPAKQEGVVLEDPYLLNLRRNLESKLSTKVEVDKKRIVINYNGTEDLNRILEIINCLEEE